MDFTTIAAFGGAAVILPIIMQALRSAIAVPDRMILLILIVLSAGWGVALFYSGLISFSPAPFIVQALLTAMTASGVHGQAATFFPQIDSVAKPVVPKDTPSP